MTRYARKPALMALLACAGVTGGLLAGTGQFRGSDNRPASLERLERLIASGSADAGTWQGYGDALSEHKRFAHAASAYQRALDLDPDRPVARFNEALALAQARDADRFFEFFTRLTNNDPRQAVDLLDRPELAGMHG